MKARSLRSLLLMALIGWLGASCAAMQAKPGCEPGSGMLIAEACQREIEADAATLDECDARVSAWETRCLR